MSGFPRPTTVDVAMWTMAVLEEGIGPGWECRDHRSGGQAASLQTLAAYLTTALLTCGTHTGTTRGRDYQPGSARHRRGMLGCRGALHQLRAVVC